MAKKIFCILRHDLWLKILTISSIALLTAGFCLPPLAVIDNSVLAAVGELAGLGAIWEADHAITKGLDTRLKVHNMELQINNDEDETKVVDDEGIDA